MLMSKPPNFDHVAISTNHQSISNEELYHTRHGRHKSERAAPAKHGKTSIFHNQSVLSNNSAMNFYPQFLQPTRMSDIIGAGSSNGSSNRAPSTRTSLKHSSSQSVAKTVSFYRSGDVYMQAFKIAITKRNFRTFDSLLEALSDRIPLPFGVRTISTPRGTHGISRLEEFEDGKSYVCSDKKTVKPLDLNASRQPRPPWFISKPRTRTKAVTHLIRRPDEESYRVPLRLTHVKTPKKIVVVRNGEPSFRHTLLMSRRTPQSFENILDDIGEIFRIRVHKLYTSDGKKVESLQSLFLGPTVYVAAGREAFQPMEYRIKRVAIQDDKKEHSSEHKTEFYKERTPKELKKTKGRWQVSIVTSELAAAATDSNVTITVYGVKGNTGPILLNGDHKATFRSGNEDQFSINVGAIGEIRKVRIAHDNSGAFPGWLCESVTLTDVTTGEILSFPCNRDFFGFFEKNRFKKRYLYSGKSEPTKRFCFGLCNVWLSRDEDDGEICREIPASIGDKPMLPVTTYDISVYTGNLWNAGTTASIYLTLFGELGDSGPRLLQHGGNSDAQMKGGTHYYKFEAVSLGVLHRVVIGHDEQKPGDGWFLDKIIVQEELVGVEEWVFLCGRWLDSGEDDGKTIRELYTETDLKSHSHGKHRKEPEKVKVDHMWELEKWKFQKGTHIVFISQATEKALRVRSDAAIDGLGDPSLPASTFEILRRRNNIRVFSNVGQSSFHIALDQNRTLGHGKGGSFCEFYVKVQADRSVLLESCRYPGQHATVDPSGKAADTRGHPNAPGKIFYVYVKGCFRHNSVILLNTSPTQVLAITSSGDVIGTGRRAECDITDVSVPTSNREKQFAHFRIVKVAEGVRMFQCEKDHKRFLRIKDGRCDGWGNGDVYCHFKVHKHRVGSYVTLEAMKHRGVFIGLDTHGRARPSVDTGDENNQLFPEVVTYGERRKERPEKWKDLEPSFTLPTYDEKADSDTYRIPSGSKSKLSTNTVITLKEREHTVTGPEDGDFRIYVTTGNSGTTESITLYVYGDKGSSGPIVLGKGMDAGIFQSGQTDEFQANLAEVGKLRKIRIGVEEVATDSAWRLKQVKMKDMNSSEIYRFKFNRWLARTKEDGATLRELPLISSDGKPAFPIMRYQVIVRTSAESARLRKDSNNETQTQHTIYLCIHGQYGDTGRRLLLRKPAEFPDEIHENKPLFAPGQTDKFQIEAVSLGELTKCVVSCPSHLNSPQTPSPSWLCEEIMIRESEGATYEYSFRCKNKWLGIRKVGAKPQVKMELAEKREIRKSASDDNLFEEGDWKVSVTTGIYENCGTSSNVMFYACGSGATSSGPIFLGTGTKGLFAAGTTEQFKVNLAEIKELEKIRLTHDNSGSDPSWFVDRIKLQCLSNDVTHSLDVKKWLSADDDPYQLCIEIPIPKPGIEVPSVLRYQVLVYTGGILGSDTDANVFITIYGKKGDTSRRSLMKSLNHDVKFQESQVDIFEVEAVDLGELTKIEIGHDGVGHGNGWFLHKVLIKESPMSTKDYIFFCNRWLDDGQDDGKIVRVIPAEPFNEDDLVEVVASEGKLKVLVTTGEQSASAPCPSDASVSLVIYGEEGKTQEILLKPDQEEDDPQKIEFFKPCQTDEFQINVADIGKIYKVRLCLEHESEWKGWFVEEISLEDDETKQQVTFICNRWLSKTEDDQQTVREFAVTRSDTDSLPVKVYSVNVKTGDRPSAATDANVFVTIRGERGDTGRRMLTSKHEETFFQRDSTSSFNLEAVDLGKLTELTISHDGQGYGSGWFLEKVTVKESEASAAEWVFPAHCWLDDHVGDCKTIRKLKLLGKFESTSDEKITGLPDSNLFDVTVLVDEVMTQANNEANLIGTVYGSSGQSVSIPLGRWRPGREKKYLKKANLAEIGEITKLRVEMEDSHLDLNVYLISVQFESISKRENYEFNFLRHFRSLSGSTVKELPVVRSDNVYQRLVSYLISVNMQLIDEEIPSQGMLELKLSGTNGDSGYRVLFRGMDGLNANKGTAGYVFEHESVDLHELQEVSLKYTSDDAHDEGGWKIGEITIKEKTLSNYFVGMDSKEYGYIGSVDRPFNSSTSFESKFLLEAIKIDSVMEEYFKDFTNEVVMHPVKEPDAKSNGLWSLTVTSAPYDQASLFNQISIRIIGSLGASSDFSLSEANVEDVTRPGESNAHFQIRSLSLDLDTEIGNLYMLRLMLNKESSAEIHKIKLKDSKTKETFLCYLNPDDRLNPSEDKDGLLTYNFPLLKPDLEPSKNHTYEIAVTTGKSPSSDTDADIHINIFGPYGETGPRSLMSLSKKPDDLFQLGQTDSFSLETVDIGEPQKIVLSHFATGGGAGWYPVEVTIGETRENVKSAYYFSCLKWLDDSVDDKLLQREFYVTGVNIVQQDADVTRSKGMWKCHIVSKAEVIKKREVDVRFTFCMNNDQSYESTQHVTDENHDFLFNFANQSTFDPSTTKFLKLRTEIKNGDEKTRKKWPLERFLMTDVDTGEKLRFEFDSAPVWEGSARGYLRELPVVREFQPHQPVYDYYVIFSTSNQSSRDFIPSRVSCQLRGKNGSTGWREIVSAKNATGKFRPGRLEMFNIEAVCLGDVVDDVMVQVENLDQQQWKLSKVKIKRDYYDEEEQIFELNKEVIPSEITTLSLSKNAFIYPPIGATKTLKNGTKPSGENETKYSVVLTWEGLSSLYTHWVSTSSDKVTSRTFPTVSFLLGGSKASSDVMSIDLKKVTQQNGKSLSNLEVPVSTGGFGDLTRIGMGILEPALPIDRSELNCFLRKVVVINNDTDQYYAFRMRHNFFFKSAVHTELNQTGLNWIELATTRPRQDPKTIAKTCSYVIKIRTADHEDAGTKAHVYVILTGKNGESGKRWMMTTSNGNEALYLPGQTIEFSMESIFLDDLSQVIIGHDARDINSAWYLDNVIVTSSLFPKTHFVFNCNKWLANLEEDTFIERTLTLDHVIDD